jgi:predicted nucleic acid-binding protein
MAYCFDTSVLIECWSRSYPPDVFPGLWLKLDELIANQEVLCPDEVRVELARQDDDLAKWVKARPHLFVPLDEAVQRATSEVLALHPLLMKATKNRNGADPFIIATARVRNLTVVTEEKGGTSAKPKIPSVCDALSVPCVNVLSFLRDQGWSFA